MTKKTVFQFFFGKSKTSIIITWIAIVLFILLLIFILGTSFFFKNNEKVENFNFYSNSEITPEMLSSFEKIVATCNSKEFANSSKKINVFICDTDLEYTIYSLYFGRNSIGNNLTIGPYNRIVISPLDSNTLIIKKADRALEDVLVHEYFHSCFTKVLTALNRLSTPEWKEEGLSEYYAASSTMPVNVGFDTLYSGVTDNSKQYKYFMCRIAILYMMKIDNLTQEEILKDKRKLNDVLNDVIKTDRMKIEDLVI